jgi:integrase
LRGSIYWAQWKHGGRPFAVSLGTKDAKEAKTRFASQVALVQTSISDGTHASRFGGDPSCAPVGGEDCPLACAWERFAASPRRPDCSADTLQQYQYQFARFADWVRERRPEAKTLSGVDETLAEAYAADLEKAVSPSTFNRHRDLLLMVFKVLLARNGHGPANPWAAIRRKRTGDSRGRRAFTAEEIRRVFLTLRARVVGRQLLWGEDGPAGEHKLAFDEVGAAGEMLTVAMLGLYTGMRLGDCCRLRWEEVDLDGWAIVRRPSKTSRRRGRPVVVPLHPDLARRLAEVRPAKAEGFVCPLKAEQYRRNRAEVSKRFSCLFRQCGIRLNGDDDGEGQGARARASVEAGFHSLRYSFVSTCRRADAPLAVVESLVGHSTPAMTRHYTDVGDEAARRAIGALPSMLDGGETAAKKAEAPTDVAALGEDEFRRLAAAVEAEARRRKG